MEVRDAGGDVNAPPAGYKITRLAAWVDNTIRPDDWFFPTDAYPPSKRVKLALALEEPGLMFAFPRTLRIQAEMWCRYFPDED